MRRTTIAAITGILLFLTNVSHAETSAGSAMQSAAQAFLSSLSPEQLKLAQLSFDDAARKDWHWIPKEHRKGLKFREMKPEQRKLALALLKTGLSDVGFAKAQSIFELEAVLHILEKDTKNIRDPEKYYYTIFGTPGDKGTWGWSVEGHHFSANYVIKDNTLIASTPSFMGANPRWMPVALDVGPEKGARTLEREEMLAFELLKSLAPDQKAKGYGVKIPNKFLVFGPPSNLHADKPVGLPASAMRPDQLKLLRDILTTYTGNVTEEAAAARWKQIEESGIDNVHFVWLGEPKLDGNHFFRIQGPSFILELDNTQADPVGTPSNHIHSVWRSPGQDFGAGD